MRYVETPRHLNLFEERTVSSPLREFTTPYLNKVVERLHSAAPELTADHLTTVGTICGVVGPFVAEKKIKIPLMLGGIIFDGLDGAMARHIAALNPDKPVRIRGSLYNSVSDFSREITMNTVKILDADRRGDKKGKSLGYVAMLTNPISRYFYWKKVSEGYDNHEAGRNVVELFGTHVGKPPCYVVATAFPEVGRVPVQSILDAATSVGNVVSIAMNNSEKYLPEKNLDDKTKAIGRVRSNFHIFTTLATAGVAIGINRYLERKNS